MSIPIFRKHRYFVKNKCQTNLIHGKVINGLVEEHYSVYVLDFYGKNCSYLFAIIREDYCRMVIHADILFKIGKLTRGH